MCVYVNASKRTFNAMKPTKQEGFNMF